MPAESKYEDQYNAIHVAHTPTMDGLKRTVPRHWRLLKAHGTAVGLPSDADMGNSEVGHNALGAGVCSWDLDVQFVGLQVMDRGGIEHCTEVRVVHCDSSGI